MSDRFHKGRWWAHLNAPGAAIPGHIIRAGKAGAPIAVVGEAFGQHRTEGQVANAQLMAASPYLLRACRLALGLLAQDSPRCTERQFRQIKSAIARAEGRKA